MKGFSDKKQDGDRAARWTLKRVRAIKAAPQKYIRSGEWGDVFQVNFGSLNKAHYKPTEELIEKYLLC